MIYPSLDHYRQLAQRYEVVPVYREIMGDTETPIAVLDRFRQRHALFLLESLEGGETWGRYSFLGVDPTPLIDSDHSAGATGGLDAIRTICRARVADIPGLPPFFGGIVGYIGYEAIGEFERMPRPKPHKCVKPRSRFLRVDQLIVFDNVRATMKLTLCTRPGADPDRAYTEALERLRALEAELAAPRKPDAAPRARSAATPMPAPEFSSNVDRDRFVEMVKTARDYIRAGDIIQVVLSRRFSAEVVVDTLDLYRALRLLNPSPYMFYLRIGDQTLVGSSPEVMVRLGGNKVELRPIAGTRPRGRTEQEDRALADGLLSDEKEKAEHVMLVDLGRNDLGRIAEAGSVQVSEFMAVERYSHVMHLVSHIQAALRGGLDAYDVIKATFPAGTLSGAPKIRAMEIVHELEPGPRGVYGGALGYVGYQGNMDLAIAIRMIEVDGATVSVQAGAGIVFDSDAQKEYEETSHKAAGMKKAVALALNGLELHG